MDFIFNIFFFSSFIADNLDSDLDMPSPVLTHLQQVTTVSSQLHAEQVPSSLTPNQPEARNGSTPSRRQDPSDSPSRSTFYARPPGATYLYSSRPLTYSGPLRFLWKKDVRSEVVVEGFMFWLDTVEMVRVAGDPSVFYSAWVFPVYIVAFLSSLRVIITPHSSLLSLASVALQDLPFFVLRVALIGVFGFVTPLLYPLKNILVSLAYIYFTWLTKLSVFKRQSMFWGGQAQRSGEGKSIQYTFLYMQNWKRNLWDLYWKNTFSNKFESYLKKRNLCWICLISFTYFSCNIFIITGVCSFATFSFIICTFGNLLWWFMKKCFVKKFFYWIKIFHFNTSENI